MKKYIIGLLAVLLIAALIAIPLKLFLIGDPVDGAQVHYSITEDGDSLRLNVATSSSAIAFRSWKFHQEGSRLYISCRKVLVSPLFSSGTYDSTIDTLKLDQLYLGGKLIWTAE